MEYPDSYIIHIRLYPLPTTLTTEKYEHANKYYFRNQMGQKPCQNYNVIDLTEKSIFRCPLPSCKHKPLNNLMIHQALKHHCQYSNQQNRQTTSSNRQNEDTQQHNLEIYQQQNNTLNFFNPR